MSGSIEEKEMKTEKSLNRSISYPTIHKDPGLESLHENSDRGSGSGVDHDDIEI
jgi:hypothetical protein